MHCTIGTHFWSRMDTGCILTHSQAQRWSLTMKVLLIEYKGAASVDCYMKMTLEHKYKSPVTGLDHLGQLDNKDIILCFQVKEL